MCNSGNPFPFSLRGCNTFIDNNNQHNSSVYIYYANSGSAVTLSEGNYCIGIANNNGKVLGLKTITYHSVASCGSQITENMNNEANDLSFTAPEFLCYPHDVSLSGLIEESGNYRIASNFNDVYGNVASNNKYQFAKGTLSNTASNAANLDEAYNAINASSNFTTNEQLWLTYYYNLYKKEYTVAEGNLANITPQNTEEGNLQKLETIQLQMLKSKTAPSNISATQRTALATIAANANSNSGAMAHDVLNQASGAHSYRFKPTQEPKAMPTTAIAANNTLQLFPNPAKDVLGVNITN